MSPILNISNYAQLALGLLTFLVSFILLRHRKTSELNEPPLVPYKYPIIGHTIEYSRDKKEFIKECHEKYGEIFSLYVYGTVRTFAGKELSPEVFRNCKDFNFLEANQEIFPVNDFMYRPHDFFKIVPKLVQINLSGEIKLYAERVQKNLIKSIDETLGDGKVLKSPLKYFRLVIAKPIAATFVGEGLCDDKELTNSFAHATNDFAPFLNIPPILSFIHPALHQKLVTISFRYLRNPSKSHWGVIRRKITPVIEKRLNEMKKFGNKYVPPIDMLQRYIELNHKDYVADINAITDLLIVTIFASVHTTSLFLTFCLDELAKHPQFHKELLEEQVRLHNNNENSYYTIEQVAKMEKLDSFIKETLRLHTRTVTLPHKTLSPYYTFSNEYQVPKGRFVYIRTREIHADEEFHGENPEEFNAFRHLNKHSSAANVERGYLAFGLGRHACPGRVFAINEIKVALHYLLLNYNIRRETKEPIISPYELVPSNEDLIFVKRA